MIKRIGILCLLLLNQLTGAVHAEEIRVAVAANFTATMQDIVAAFEQTSSHRVVVSFGSSGQLFAHIQNGAPFQAFFSADQAKPHALESQGLTVPHSRFTYAVGALALWSAKPGFIDAGPARLQNGQFNKLALANPKLAPYGTAAVQVLDRLHLKEATEAKWVQGQNIAQTYQFVRTGNADLGFVALAQIMANGVIHGGSGWIVPEQLHQPIRQDAVLLPRGKDSVAARSLLHFVRGDTAKAIMASYGYRHWPPTIAPKPAP